MSTTKASVNTGTDARVDAAAGAGVDSTATQHKASHGRLIFRWITGVILSLFAIGLLTIWGVIPFNVGHRVCGTGAMLILALTNAALLTNTNENQDWPKFIETFVTILNVGSFTIVNLGIWGLMEGDASTRALATEFALLMLGIALQLITKYGSTSKTHTQ